MIEILHEYKKDWSMFTLASLLDKSRDFRLHLYVHEDDWADAPIDWVIANFDEVKILQILYFFFYSNLPLINISYSLHYFEYFFWYLAFPFKNLILYTFSF